jgi:hypothetical protein
VDKFKSLNDKHLAKIKDRKTSTATIAEPDPVVQMSFRDSQQVPTPKSTKFKSLNEKLASRYETKEEPSKISNRSSNLEIPLSSAFEALLTEREKEKYGDRCP